MATSTTSYYESCAEKIQVEVEKKGSSIINHLEIIALPWEYVNGGINYDRVLTAKEMAKRMKAVNESMIRSHFGADIMDHLFHRFTKILAADNKEVEHVSLVISLIRNV
ncbi:hypothetical protein HRI_002367200 [Hibiscus trionum]|uniref:Uncharacterized protein n=1 Tax=Hibiscus trionum TaxID=183268 RepID=A0A9W7I0C6_HIBTR|nr:hypothetical protein HRI_002367200 [Hibiscus trionum]